MPNTNSTSTAFTTAFNKKTNRLINESSVEYNNSKLSVKALWDTGATRTCISEGVSKDLSMIPTGRKKIYTPSGTKVVNTYLLNIILPNDIVIKDVEVCDSDIGNQGLDVLIGMDIILLGDFAVSNFNDKTTFTFRVPSKQTTDYVKQIVVENAIDPKHGIGKKRK